MVQYRRPRYHWVIFGNSLRVTTVGLGINSRVHVPDKQRQKLLKEGPMRKHLRRAVRKALKKESIVEMRDITPELIITVTAFSEMRQMDMRIPFKIPAEV